MTDEHNTHDEFAPEPEAGDLLHLSELVKRAGQLKYEVSQTELEQKVRKTELQDILERQIPELMLQCGGFESLTLAGFKVELDRPTYAGIPSKSAIDKEKDDDVRCDMQERRALAIQYLEENAPALLKRNYEFEFDRNSTEEADAFEQKLAQMEDAPSYHKEVTVHPQTLAKYVRERIEEGDNVSAEVKRILGVSTKVVAKISK